MGPEVYGHHFIAERVVSLSSTGLDLGQVSDKREVQPDDPQTLAIDLVVARSVHNSLALCD